MIRLDPQLTSALLSRAESGMGYQLVVATETNGSRREGIAYNAELLLYEGEPRQELRTVAFESLLKNARNSAGAIKSIEVRARPARGTAAVMERAAKTPTEAKDAPIEQTESGEVFKRFSAYRNDRRILADGSMLPGTYATTEADARNVRTGSEAVRRYALPNPAPASWVFTSRPKEKTAIQRGIVAAAHGQPGGGVEVIFTNGTQAGTTTGPEKIPD